MKKVKTYILTVSKVFPVTHKRKGEPTGFIESIGRQTKLHTIRANYPLWKKRIDEVVAGDAVLRVVCWSGKPYKSKQETIMTLDSSSGIGVQQLSFDENELSESFITDGTSKNSFGWDKYIRSIELAENDGLSTEDFREWFKKYDLSEPMAIIHFTKFRY